MGLLYSIEGLSKCEIMKGFGAYLHHEERSRHTIEKYLHDVSLFWDWVGKRPVTRETVADWKEQLCGMGRAVVTINSSLAALHSFFAFMGWQDCRVKYLKRQQRLFRDDSKELTKREYERLVQTAKAQGNERLALLFETICATGIRVSEVKYITLEAVLRGQAEISLKGKIRTILLPNKLAHKLKKYARKQKITSGELFRTKSGKSLSRRQIWSDMKGICKAAGVDGRKVYPHNLRHLFARAFYKACRDIVKLANVLGHSSVETTRIYLVTTCEEHTRELDRLGLVS